MEDLKTELECHLMKTDSVCPKLRGLVRRLRCIHAFLLMRRDVAKQDVTAEIQKYHTALEQAEEELARSIEKAFIEKTGYLRAFQEQIESEYNTINTLKRDVEHFLLELQCGSNCQIDRGRTLSQLFRMMWQNCSVDLEIDDNIDCLEFCPSSSPESLPKVGTVIKNYQKNKKALNSDTFVNDSNISGGKENSENMIDGYCQTDDDSVIPDYKVVQHEHVSCQTDDVKISSIKHCTSVETQTTKPKVKPDNPGCSVKYLTSQLSSVGLIRSDNSLSSDSLEGMACKTKRKKDLHVTNITSPSKKPARYLMEGINGRNRSHRDINKSSRDYTATRDRNNSGFSSSNWLEETGRDVSLSDSAYSTPAKLSEYDNGDKSVQSEAHLTPDRYWDLDDIESDKDKGTETIKNTGISQISGDTTCLSDQAYSQSNDFTVTDSKLETMNVLSNDASEKVSKISFVNNPESLSAEEEFIVTDIVETMENWEEEAASFSEMLNNSVQKGNYGNRVVTTSELADNCKTVKQMFDNQTNNKSELHFENQESSDATSMTSLEDDLESDKNNNNKSMVASSETTPDSVNSLNVGIDNTQDISVKSVENNAVKMPDSENFDRSFTVEKVATYAMKRSVSLDSELDEKKNYETYVATDKISKTDHSKRDVKSANMHRVTKQTESRLPIIPQESVISEHVRRSNNSSYRGRTNIPSPLPAKLLFKFGVSSRNPASGDYGLSFPIGVASNSKGEIIVADTGNNRIRMFDAQGRFVYGIGSNNSPLKRPSAIVINDNDYIFVKDDICIHVFTPDGKFVRRVGEGQLKAPYGLSLTHDGFLVTLDTKPAREYLRLVIFNQDGSDSTWYPFYTSPHGYTPGSKCRFLAVNGETVIVSDLGRSKVLLKNFLSGQMYSFGRMGRNPGEILEPSGIAVDYDGNILLGDSRNNRVQIFTSGGEFLCGVKFSEGSVRPSDIHLTPDNKLIVTNYIEHQIKVYQLGAT